MFEEIVKELEVSIVDEGRDCFLKEGVRNCCNCVHARQPTDSIQLKSISAIWRCDILFANSREMHLIRNTNNCSRFPGKTTSAC